MFELRVVLPELILEIDPDKQLPEWTNLDYHQCSHCPLNKEDNPKCPVAVRLVDIGDRLGALPSTATVTATVITTERITTAVTTTETATQSLIGLAMALSGCPHLDIFRPLARFHLPFSNIEETVFRAASAHLLRHYFNNPKNLNLQEIVEDLVLSYEKVHKVNLGIAKRLRAAQVFDELNAINLLDGFAHIFEDGLEEIAPFFAVESGDARPSED